MKKIILNALAALSFAGSLTVSSRVAAQGSSEGGFSTNSLTYIDPVGTSFVQFNAIFIAYGERGAAVYVNFVCSPGITCLPSGVSIDLLGLQKTNVTIIVNLDSVPNCFFGPEGVFCYVGNSYLNALWIYGYTYDPKIIGHVSLYNSDTLNFGSVPIGRDTSQLLTVSIDSLNSTPDSCVFRELYPLNVHTPFSSTDTITPQFGCGAIDWRNDYYYFQPSEIKQYIDTTYLYDPIGKDSTMLILIGEGVAASVGNSVAEASRVTISPNPCDKHCTLSMNDGQIEHVIVRNLLGECVLDIPSLHNDEFSISTASFTDGIYFIEVRSGENVYQERVVVAH